MRFLTIVVLGLVIALAGLVSMAIELPHSDDAVIMMTELQRPAVINAEQEKPKTPETALESKLDTPSTLKPGVAPGLSGIWK